MYVEKSKCSKTLPAWIPVPSEAHRIELVMKNTEPLKTHFALIPEDYKSLATSRHLHVKLFEGFRRVELVLAVSFKGFR